MQTVSIRIDENAFENVMYLLRKLSNDVEIIDVYKDNITDKKQKELTKHTRKIKKAIMDAKADKGTVRGKLGEL